MLCVHVSDYVLEIVEGPEAGKQIPLPERTIEVGREPGIDIELSMDHLVSRRHARLTPTQNGVVVEDLGSSNGTFADANEIHAPAVLTPGSRVTIGVTVLELRTTASASAGTVMRPVPSALTAIRTTRVSPLPDDSSAPGLAVEERAPDYVPVGLDGSSGKRSPLSPLLDIHTKKMARTAPLAIFVLATLVVVIALALR